MPHSTFSFLAVGLFVFVHLFAEKIRTVKFSSKARFLSFGGGVAIAYVFLDLLPKLNKSNAILQESFRNILPFTENHVFIMALLGFLLFFVVDRTSAKVGKEKAMWLSLFSYSIFNFLVGYAVVDPNNQEVQPLLIFSFAMALHYFTNDYSLSESHGKSYDRYGKWILTISLISGWFLGLFFTISQTAVALVSAFIGGGVIMNVIRHELPKEFANDLKTFLIATLFYAALLLTIGQ